MRYTAVMWQCECGIKCEDTAAHNRWHIEKDKRKKEGR